MTVRAPHAAAQRSEQRKGYTQPGVKAEDGGMIGCEFSRILLTPTMTQVVSSCVSGFDSIGRLSPALLPLRQGAPGRVCAAWCLGGS